MMDQGGSGFLHKIGHALKNGAKKEHPLRVLCFGDSLTYGYNSHGNGDHPYAILLKAIIQAAMPNRPVVTDVDGLCGDLVCPSGQFLKRMKDRCSDTSVSKYDIIIVLGGTNDTAFAIEPEKIFNYLVQTWDVALASGAEVIALTIPERAAEFGSERGQKLTEKRLALNGFICNHRRERWQVMDLCAAVPYQSMSEDRRKRFWDDGLHLTADGYDLMGQRIAEFMLQPLLHPGRHAELKN